jgi:hypothetical protein
LAGIVLTFVLGVVLDTFWYALGSGHRAYKNEAWMLWQAPSTDAFSERKAAFIDRERAAKLQAMMTAYPDFRDAGNMIRNEGFASSAARMSTKLKSEYELAAQKTREKYDALVKKAPEERKERKAALEQIQRDRRQEEAALLQRYIADRQSLEELNGRGIASSFIDWESYCLSNAVASVRRGNIMTGLSSLLGAKGSMIPPPYRTMTLPNTTDFDASTNNPEGVGLVGWVMLMGWGLVWLLTVYPIYGIIWVLLALAIWAIFGGAICRVAALHAAREEKIAMSAAVKFSISKFFSFLTAPLLPVIVILVVGLLISLSGLVGSVPVIGEWLLSLLFFVPLIFAAIIAFLLAGFAAGWPLMWPTISIEGSDSFDAISRSYSYAYQRPFRYALYALVAAIYGTLCYLVVRLFAFITLLAAHGFVGLWMNNIATRDSYAPGAGKLDVMWAGPTFDNFRGPIQSEVMTGSERWASHFIGLWVCVVAWVVLAFLVCFFFSAATNIYFLLRRKVDATDLDDVYMDDEDRQPPAAQQTTVTVQTTTTEGQTTITETRSTTRAQETPPETPSQT